jgi:hypothetical protein
LLSVSCVFQIIVIIGVTNAVIFLAVSYTLQYLTNTPFDSYFA